MYNDVAAAVTGYSDIAGQTGCCGPSQELQRIRIFQLFMLCGAIDLADHATAKIKSLFPALTLSIFGMYIYIYIYISIMISIASKVTLIAHVCK